MRAPALDVSRRLVTEMFPSAVAAWLGGSVVRGDATETSDLDITVLLTGEDVLGDRARAFLAAGPPPLSVADLAAARYAITDLIDDLTGSTSAVETVGIATRMWAESLRLLLIGAGRWAGSGKGLVREVVALDPALADRSVAALRSALGWSPDQLVAWADQVLAPYGGRLFDGYRAEAPAESTASTRPPESAGP